jgi:LysR family transcriptional regulator, glycine cleavage system transcriptional activator
VLSAAVTLPQTAAGSNRTRCNLRYERHVMRSRIARSLLSAVPVFEAAARHRSFTKAGTELGLTQSAVSWRIRQLEEHLGVALFVRSASGLGLTVEGARLLPSLRDGLARIDAALVAARAALPTRLAISCTESFAVRLLAPRLPAFRALYPDIDVQLDTSYRLVDLAVEPFDVAIRSGDGTWPGLRTIRLLEAKLTPMAAASRLDAPIERPRDLLRWPLLTHDEEDWARWFRAVGEPPPPKEALLKVNFTSQLAIAEAAASGLGIALLTPGLFRDAVAEGRFVQPFERAIPAGFSYWFCTLDTRHDDPTVAAFERWLLAALARS